MIRKIFKGLLFLSCAFTFGMALGEYYNFAERLAKLERANNVLLIDAKGRFEAECRIFLGTIKEVYVDAYYNANMNRIICCSYSPRHNAHRWYDLQYIRKKRYESSPTMKIKGESI